MFLPVCILSLLLIISPSLSQDQDQDRWDFPIFSFLFGLNKPTPEPSNDTICLLNNRLIDANNLTYNSRGAAKPKKVCLKKCPNGDTDCQGKGDEVRTHCTTKNTKNVCVECLENPHCTTVAKSKCNEGQNKGDCVKCETNEDCTHLNLPVCNHGVCRGECEENTDCPDKEICDKTNAAKCVECRVKNDCKKFADADPHKFDKSFNCNAEKCVQCLVKDDCKGNYETCNAMRCGSWIQCRGFWYAAANGGAAAGPELAIHVLDQNPGAGVNGVPNGPDDRVHLHLNPDTSPNTVRCKNVVNHANFDATFMEKPQIMEIIQNCRNNLTAGQTWTHGAGGAHFFPDTGAGGNQFTNWWFYPKPVKCFF